MNCSDYSTAWVCRNCGSLITLGFDQSLGNDETGKEYCRVCDKEEDGVKVEEGKISVNVRGKKDRKGVMDVIAVPCESSSSVYKTLLTGRCVQVSVRRNGLYGYQTQRRGDIVVASPR